MTNTTLAAAGVTSDFSRVLRITRAFAEGAVVVIGFGVAILLIGLPVALLVRGSHIVAAWLAGL